MLPPLPVIGGTGVSSHTPSTYTFSLWGMSSIPSIPSSSKPSVSPPVASSQPPASRLGQGKSPSFTVGSGFSPPSDRFPGNPVVSNTTFPSGLNVNIGSQPSPLSGGQNAFISFNYLGAAMSLEVSHSLVFFILLRVFLILGAATYPGILTLLEATMLSIVPSLLEAKIYGYLLVRLVSVSYYLSTIP